ncbi:transcriptional regulator [Actinomadura sp. NBRC 104425]|uniref:helix-turn-helix domain-containing protein n=1 Tax=Actinomadura sp. NBRC 104425 TaxID=3032204 RepID=UPI0024A29600|nr:helix-turn-helix domain-containing protein [Actinomadura sp. NBRC 104425]GLZ13697.1 transcriptional regulator [Actinomadura sp. NBRC 104425]
MANDALRQAMISAKLTEQELAEACQVDVKTVSRWVADEGRTPHPRHRWAASEVLGVDEAVLWPDAIRKNVKTGPDREIVAVYPYRSACPKSVWRRLISEAGRELTFAGYTNYFLWLEIPNLRTVLRRKAERGCRVRFLLGDPESDVTRRREELEQVPLTVSTRIKITLDELSKIIDVPGIEVRFGDEHIAMSVFIFDDEMLVTPHLAHLVGHDSPMLHVQRHQEDGLFDRFAYHVAELWNCGRPITITDQQNRE